MIDISVVIPAYNAQHTITACFNSIYHDLNQLEYSYEIIIVNDGSRDGTRQILEQLQNEYIPLVIIINQENKGVSAARNAGLKIARGKYISFCDSDDMWLTGKTKKTIDILSKYNNIKCLGGKYTNKVEDNDSGDALKHIKLYDQLFKNYFSPQTVTISRKIIDDGLFFDERWRYSEDAEYFNRITKKYYSAVLINRCFAMPVINKYVYGDSGLSGSLWEMEKGELNNIYTAYKVLQANWLICFFASIFSIIKYIKRFIICSMRSFKGMR